MQRKRIRHTITKSPIIKPLLAWLYHRGLTADDMFVASYPRAGSTWLRFLLFELLTGKPTTFATVDKYIPDIGRHFNAPRILDKEKRLIKTHEPYRQEYGRAIYLVRDVRDVVISEYAFQRLWGLYDGSFQSFLDDFLAGKVNRYGSWDNHANSWLDAWQAKTDKILMVRFDELRHDPFSSLVSIMAFLGVRVTSSQIEQAIANNTTAKMRAKERKNEYLSSNSNFVRKGKVGGWKGNLTDAQVQQIESQSSSAMQRLGYLHD